MADNVLNPMPFQPVYGAFNLNTFIPGSSDYEIMARVVETYNAAVSKFNEIIAMYSDIDQTIQDLTDSYESKLDAYKKDINSDFGLFTSTVNATIKTQNDRIAEQNVKVQELTKAVEVCQAELKKLVDGEYIDNYVKALAGWIDNNLETMVSSIVKFVWFEIDKDGYFVAYIPDTWSFLDFSTDLDPDSDDYGKLALEWGDDIQQ